MKYEREFWLALILLLLGVSLLCYSLLPARTVSMPEHDCPNCIERKESK